MKKLVVVGDKFEEFAKLNGTITQSQLSIMTQLPAKTFAKKSYLMPGLGCKSEEVIGFVEGMDNSEHLDMTSLVSFYSQEIVPNKYTHQKNIHNVLIGKAKKLNEYLFELPFIIDERNMFMGDHQTGCHVQGMIITEAFRQTFIAITEEFYLDFENDQESYFIINSMNIEFEDFLFPLPAQIYFEPIDINKNSYRTKIQAKISIKQAEKVCAIMNCAFTVYPMNNILEKEKILANQVLNSYLTDSFIKVA